MAAKKKSKSKGRASKKKISKNVSSLSSGKKTSNRRTADLAGASVETSDPVSKSSEIESKFINSEDEFIQAIRLERIEKGFGFMPLVGAGLSAASGVPLIREIEGYLHKCIALALGVKPEVSQGKPEKYHKKWRWHPQHDEWPPISVGQSYRSEDTDWQLRIGQDVDQLTSLMKNDVQGFWSDYPEVKLFIEAYGATAEWRTSLNFLARLREKDSPEGKILSLGAVDAHVYDNFFLSSVLGKTPTLGHRMLARLANPLGVGTIVTLNFEDLIEQAFLDIQNPLTVYAVHHHAGLPAYHSKFGKNVLIKMHGDRYGLRADYSLDEMPSVEDCRHFTSYLARRTISPKEWEGYIKGNGKIPARNHLLVVGLAVQEERILELIRNAKTVLEDDFKVYWIAYTESDAKQANARLESLFGASPKDGDTSSGGAQYKVIQHHFVGLLFYNIYQHLTGSLPPDGAIFPARARVAVPPTSFDRSVFDDKEESKNAVELASEIDGAIDRCFEDVAETENPRKLVVVHSDFSESKAVNEKFYGIVSSASLSFSSQLNKGRQAVWLDLGEVADADSLYELLLHTVARKAGVMNWMPVLAQSSEYDLGMSKTDLAQARQQELARITHNPDKKWIIYLNARSGGAGANFVSVESYDEKFDKSGPNGWLDRGVPSPQYLEPGEHGKSHSTSTLENWTYPNTNCGADFIDLIDGFCRRECPNIAVVLLCSKRKDHEQTLFNHLSQGDYIDLPITKSCFNEGEMSAKLVVERAEQWIEDGGKDEGEERKRFLFACSSVNRVRSPSLLWSWAFHGGGEIGDDHSLRSRSAKTSNWLKELHKMHVVRLQTGGFVWMEFDIRRELRGRLRQKYGVTDEIIPRIHQGIAEWYSHLHVSSRSSRAATEAAYHQCIRTRFLLERVPGEYEKQVCDEITHQVLQSLGAAIRMLKQARPSILSDGFTQGTCQRLEHLRYKQCRDKIVQRVLDDYNPDTKKGLGKRRLLDPGEETINADKIDAAIKEFEYLTCSLNFEIAQEIGNHLHAFKRIHELEKLNQSSSVRMSLKTKNCFASLGIATRSPVFSNKWLSYGFAVAQYDLMDELETVFNDDRTRDQICDEIRTRTRVWLQREAEKITGKSNCAIHEDVKLQLATGVVKLLQRKMQASLCEALHARSLLRRGVPFQAGSGNTILVTMFDTAFLERKNGRRKAKERRFVRFKDAKGQVVGEVNYDDVGVDSLKVPTTRRIKQGEFITFDLGLSKGAWRTASQCYDLAIEAKRAIQRDGLRYQERQEGRFHNTREVSKDGIASWFDDQQRLDTQHALCLALAGDYSKAFRRLNEAESFLVELPNSHGMEQAIIDLHRAAIFQLQALSGAKDSLNPIFRSVYMPGEKEIEIWENVTTSLDNVGKEAEFGNVALALLEDSLQSLDRANPILKRHRKNAWWTTWNFELRMKLVEYELRAAFSGSPCNSLPYLGTKDAPCNMPTELDGLLDNSRRMIRMDVYRLARIVESYSSCLLILGMWRKDVLGRYEKSIDDNTADRHDPNLVLEALHLHVREKNMLAWLANVDAEAGNSTCVVGALPVLKKLIVAREALDKMEVRTRLAPEVSYYVKDVIYYAERVAKFTSENLKRTKTIRIVPKKN